MLVYLSSGLSNHHENSYGANCYGFDPDVTTLCVIAKLFFLSRCCQFHKYLSSPRDIRFKISPGV